jgi:catechol 2,3-dioxygenase-like lactoylglutathione lyase family enzyme
MTILALDHVQLAMPAGGEAAARGFYLAMLGLAEVPKPAELAGRGGCWFERGDVHVHLGVEADFRPAKKAHPAFRVAGLAALRSRLDTNGFATRDDVAVDGVERCFVDDPFGNRIELIEGSKTVVGPHKHKTEFPGVRTH